MLNYLIFLSIVTFCLYVVLNKLAHTFNFLDYPNQRKIHSQPTPYVGGLVISFIYIIIILLDISKFELFNLILIFSAVISIVGLIDDKFDINPFLKIILQSVPIYFLISKGLYLTDLGNYENFGIISLGQYGQIFTLLCSLLLINAFNYSDGIDGLLGTLFINIFLSFLLFSFFYEKFDELKLLFYLILPLFIFLLFNFSAFNLPKIFLGDSGSNLLGFITGFVMIYLYKVSFISPSILIWPVALIIYEFLSTNIARIIKGKNLFHSGNDHLHYQIKKIYNLNILQINIVINTISFSMTFLGVIVNYFFGSTFSLILFIILFFVYIKIKKSYLEEKYL